MSFEAYVFVLAVRWFQQQAAPDLIGQPLATDFPYDLVGLQVCVCLIRTC